MTPEPPPGPITRREGVVLAMILAVALPWYRSTTCTPRYAPPADGQLPAVAKY